MKWVAMVKEGGGGGGEGGRAWGPSRRGAGEEVAWMGQGALQGAGWVAGCVLGFVRHGREARGHRLWDDIVLCDG